ncbi:hypothetical protein ACVWZW_003933 [Bradyrhizobium sp. F1.13.4]
MTRSPSLILDRNVTAGMGLLFDPSLSLPLHRDDHRCESSSFQQVTASNVQARATDRPHGRLWFKKFSAARLRLGWTTEQSKRPSGHEKGSQAWTCRALTRTFKRCPKRRVTDRRKLCATRHARPPSSSVSLRLPRSGFPSSICCGLNPCSSRARSMQRGSISRRAWTDESARFPSSAARTLLRAQCSSRSTIPRHWPSTSR